MAKRKESSPRRTRRAALLATLVLASAALAGSAQDGFGQQPVADSAHVMRVGNGGVELNSPLGITVDTAHREVVVANTGAHRVEFFDFRAWPRGAFVHRVPDPAGGLRDGLPSQVLVDGKGRLLVSDLLASYVDVVDVRGRSIARITPPSPDDRLDAGGGPGALAMLPDGHLLVASRGKFGRIHVFDGELRFVRSFGEPGHGPGRLGAITALAVTPRGDVVVACASTEYAVQVFDPRGVFIRGFGIHDLGPGNFSLPSGVAVTQDGRIWVSDAIRHVVQVFDLSGTYVGTVGGWGVGPGEFQYPSALASDGRGMLALAERAGNRFQLMWVR